MKTLFLSTGFLLLTAFGTLESQETTRLAILPLLSNGVDTVYAHTSESILRTEIAKLSSSQIIPAQQTRELLAGKRCAENECAVEAGKALGATQVLICELSALGEKIIVRYSLAEVPSGVQLLIDQVTSLTAEDLEMVMKRIARSVVSREPLDKGVEVGNVLETEAKEQLRRTSRKNFGIGFGYLYPSSGYDNSDKSFVVDGRFDYEMDQFAAGMVLGIRKGFAMNLYGSYLASRTDICPYVGGGFGFHWVAHNDIFSNSVTRREFTADGFELSAHGGMRVLHTFNFQMIFHLEFTATLNDYNDRALVFTIGIL